MQELIHKELDSLIGPSQVPFIVAVSAHETGGFKSPVLVHNKNLFGMKLPKVRPSLALGENRGHAVYNSFTDSIQDFYLWYQYTEFPKVYNLKSFVRNMHDRKYFEADFNAYLRGVSGWFDRIYNFNSLEA